jgi:hypothetical protein
MRDNDDDGTPPKKRMRNDSERGELRKSSVRRILGLHDFIFRSGLGLGTLFILIFALGKCSV